MTNEVTKRYLLLINRLIESGDVTDGNAFAKKIGISASAVTEMSKGRTNVGLTSIQKTVFTYPSLNLDWLISGEGEIFKTKTPKNVVKENDHKNDHIFDHKRKLQKTWSKKEEEIRQAEAFRNATPVIYDMPEMLSVVKEPETPYSDNSVCVPVVHIEAAAGGGAFNIDFNEDVDTMMLPKSFLSKTSCMRYCIDIRGESMEPTLLDKTRIVVRLLDRSDWVNVRNGNVYVVTDREGLTYVKRIRNRLKARGVLVLTSDNPDQDRYHSFELEESEIQHIWAVELYIADHIPPMAQRFDGMRAELDALRDRLDEMELRMR